MTFRGRVENGHVVFSDGINLPEGMEVVVVVPSTTVPIDDTASGPTLLETLKDFVGSAKNLPPDASTNVDHYLYGLPKQ